MLGTAAPTPPPLRWAIRGVGALALADHPYALDPTGSPARGTAGSGRWGSSWLGYNHLRLAVGSSRRGGGRFRRRAAGTEPSRFPPHSSHRTHRYFGHRSSGRDQKKMRKQNKPPPATLPAGSPNVGGVGCAAPRRAQRSRPCRPTRLAAGDVSQRGGRSVGGPSQRGPVGIRSSVLPTPQRLPRQTDAAPAAAATAPYTRPVQRAMAGCWSWPAVGHGRGRRGVSPAAHFSRPTARPPRCLSQTQTQARMCLHPLHGAGTAPCDSAESDTSDAILVMDLFFERALV